MFVSALPDPTCNSEKSANGGNKQMLLLLLLLYNKRYYYITHLLLALINWFRRQGRLQFTNQQDIKQIWPYYYVSNLNCMISRPNFSTIGSACGFIRDDPLKSDDSELLRDTTYLSSALLKTLERIVEETKDFPAYANSSFSVENLIEYSFSSVISSVSSTSKRKLVLSSELRCSA